MSRNYRKEYDNYHGSEKQKKRRAKRNAARSKAVKNGSASKGGGKDVDHKDGNPNNNSSSNLRVTSKSSNRSFKRTKTARKAKSYNQGGATKPAAKMGGEKFISAAKKYGLGTDNRTLNKIVNLVNQGMSVDAAARKVASGPKSYNQGGKATVE